MEGEARSFNMEVGRQLFPDDNRPAVNEWMDKLKETRLQRSELNRLVMNYLVMAGYKEAADSFERETGLEANVTKKWMDERISIREALSAGEIPAAIDKVNDLDPGLLEENPQIYFHLQQQQLIEMIRQEDLEGAVQFAQSELASWGEDNPTFLDELEQVMGLLAFEHPEDSPFGDLMHVSHREKVASELNAAIMEKLGQRSASGISNLMKVVHWSQSQLEKANARFLKLTDMAEGKFDLSVRTSVKPAKP